MRRPTRPPPRRHSPEAASQSRAEEDPVKASVDGASDTPADTAAAVVVGVVPLTVMAGADEVKAKGAEKILGWVKSS
jgi:hypothetical protein